LPIVNEEYGYEDHYPGPWGGGKSAPARSADSRRRLAWEISMAGGYQTTGESAANGLGGWINGLGDDSMTMLDGYRLLRTFFESIPWWRMEPRPDLVAAPVRCLAETGVRHVVYSPDGRVPETRFPTDGFRTRIFNPRSGDFTDAVSDSGDWVFLWEAT
jgi:hypothetical protein